MVGTATTTRFLSAEDEARIRKVLPQFSCRDRAIYSMVRICGLEVEDLRLLKAGDVWDFERNELKQSIPRWHTSRSVLCTSREIPAAARPDLTGLIERFSYDPETPLFNSRLKRPISRWAARRVIRLIGEAAGVSTALNIQNARANAARDYYLACGKDLAKTSQWLGHTDVQSTNVLVEGAAQSAERSRAISRRCGTRRRTLLKEVNFQRELGSEYERETNELKAALHEAECRVTGLQNEVALLRTAHDAIQRKLSSAPEYRSPSRLCDFPIACELYYGPRIIFDKPAIRSLGESPFRDVASAWQCIEALNTGFFPHYASGEDFGRVQDILDRYRIGYGSHMSDKTVGRFSSFYVRRFEGNSVTLQKHLKLGSTYDPCFCFRLFFEWLPKSRQILILHAGRHHPTSE